MAENKNNNKNSFRDMMLIIFVVLICFGITIFGIAYLTNRVFSSSTDVPEVAETNHKDIITDPDQGDVISFTPVEEPSNEVTPNTLGNNIQATVTPGQAVPQVSQAPLPPIIETTPSNNNVSENAPKPEQATNTPAKEPVKEVAPKAQADQTSSNKKDDSKKQVAKQSNAEKQPAKASTPKKEGDYVVQLVAVQSREAANRELAKYKKHYPDVFIKQVQINGQTWYRIRMGISKTQAEAQLLADKAAIDFKIQPKVTKNK